ncbi:cysteine hydrolase [Rhodococcus fascians]|nr:cysteine hydrolase [Rhodococcus fascians]MBY4040424.1 cysteine hydrolase [Rhodococcus fascians]MBY4061030.1 cysteine hydrolase [Rhodococcus fascians]MBY4071166.1 cysteine hydrolase [Rhodococcus fascians]MBY4140710.1 cysteine hydrolase [Rhodococcus fascians]
MIHRFGTNTALVVIDPQLGVDSLGHWGGPVGRRNNPDAEQRISKLLVAWRERNWPVFITRHESLELDSPLHPSSVGCDYKPGLGPVCRDEELVKSVNGAFFGTDLDIRLRRRAVDRIVVAGFFTNMCVETTVRTAGNLAYDTYLAHDACSTTNRIGPEGVDYDAETVHALSVASLHGEFCTALSSLDLIDLCATDNPALVRIQGNEVMSEPREAVGYRAANLRF